MAAPAPGRGRGARLAALAVVALALLAACTEHAPAALPVATSGAAAPVVTVAPSQPIVIGISTILAGDLDALGVPLAQAAELAGRGVAIDGHPLRFERANGACSAAGGADAARTLIADGAVAVVGPVCPAAVEAAQPLYAAAGIPVLSPSSTAIGSTQPAGRAPYANFFRLAYSDAIQATALAAFATSTLHAGSVYVVYFDDLYGVNLRDAFTTAFAGHIDGAAAFAAGATAFPSALQGIRDTQPDAVLYLGYEPEAVAFVRALRAAGLTMPLLAPDGVHDPQFVARAGTVANGTYVALPDPPLAGDAYARFSAAYRAAYGQPAEAAPFTAQAFDAATLVIDALRQVATPSGGALMVDEGALRAAIARADLAGASGHIRFDAAGNNVGTTTPVRILVVRDGAFQDVVP